MYRSQSGSARRSAHTVKDDSFARTRFFWFFGFFMMFNALNVCFYSRSML